MSCEPSIAPIVWSETAGELATTLADDAATRHAGACLAAAIAASFAAARDGSDTSLATLITLSGDLGAGKTTLVQGFLKALGVTGRVRSPTFTLVETYNVQLVRDCASSQRSGATINHFDCYRFSGAEEWFEAGFDELIANAAISLVEWPEKALNCLPSPDIALTLEVISPHSPHSPSSSDSPDLPDQRMLRLRAGTPRGEAWLNQIKSSSAR